ncbi:MAG: hypothetical protein M3Q23_16765 [Actinomycetota bacterium]|nr:hypothetical protein [Actinomycetota bacterium]
MTSSPALGVLVVVVVGFGLIASGCGGGAGPEPTAPGRTAGTGVPVCEPEFRPPPGFAARGTFTVRESDHVGKRISYTDGRGRILVFASGITGEFGEGEPVAGTVSVTSGERARLLGRGSAWFLLWSGPAPCVNRAVVGRGLDRTGFLRLLERSGVVAPRT